MKLTLKSIAGAAVLAATLAGNAQAAPYSFEDAIAWGGLGAYVTEGNSLSYTHDLNDDVDFVNGDLVTEAYLELDFNADLSDRYGSFSFLRWDYREYAQVGYDGSAWVNLGEVDNGQYDIVLDIDWLNDDGELDVTIAVSNPLGNATAWLEQSRLYGTAETGTPVSEPATIALLGLGLIGFAGARARKKSA